MFYSILYPGREEADRVQNAVMPSCFNDLFLDKIVSAALKNRAEFRLEEFYYTPLRNKSEVAYRHDVLRNLSEGLFEPTKQFSSTIHFAGLDIKNTSAYLAADKSKHGCWLTRGRYLDAVRKYCEAIIGYWETLNNNPLKSQGLSDFAEYLGEYIKTEGFISLHKDAVSLSQKLSDIEYCMLISSGNIRVRRYEGQEDQSKRIIELFRRFQCGTVTNYRRRTMESPRAAHVEEAVLDLLSGIYKDEFEILRGFCVKYGNITDGVILRFAREVQFYISWLDYIEPMKSVGLEFCFPEIADNDGIFYVNNGFDLALAEALSPQKPVTNDFILTPPERIIVVTGPNQGGKTTFARAFGQAHYFASLGLSVPGSGASLKLFDKLLTHFEREENIDTLNGKLADELQRLKELFINATPDSVIIINEIFASTTTDDALSLGEKMMDKIASLRCPAVCVTFLDELASHGPETVSMMSTVDEDDETRRTYKIIRRPADGLAYALHIAERYGLTYQTLVRRLSR
jgi:hypothetical protein